MGWTLIDLAKHVRVSTKTLTDFENGIRTPYPKNLDDIRAAFEKHGVVFSSVEGESQDGVALKWGMEDPKRPKNEHDKVSSDADSQETKQAMIDFWRDNPEAWERLSEVGKDVLRETRGEALGGDDLFGAAAE